MKVGKRVRREVKSKSRDTILIFINNLLEFKPRFIDVFIGSFVIVFSIVFFFLFQKRLPNILHYIGILAGFLFLSIFIFLTQLKCITIDNLKITLQPYAYRIFNLKIKKEIYFKDIIEVKYERIFYFELLKLITKNLSQNIFPAFVGNYDEFKKRLSEKVPSQKFK